MPRSQVAPEDMFIEVASGVGKAVSFLLRICYIFHNFPLLLFRSPRFPFLLLQVYENIKKPLKNEGFFDFWGAGKVKLLLLSGRSFGFVWAAFFFDFLMIV